LNGEALYRRAPVWMQTVLLNAYALRLHRQRYGRPFPALQAEWSESEWWDPSQLRAWQDRRVTEMVRFAHDHVPYYRRRFAEHGVRPQQFGGVDDLPQLPLLTKEDVRRARTELLASPHARHLLHGHTSGTTGSPLGVWYDRPMAVANNAADWRQKGWGGLAQSEWCGLLLGRVIVPAGQRQPPFWRPDYLHRQLWLSSFHMNDRNLDLYVRELRRRGIRFLEGYPSTLYILARHLLRAGERLPLRAVFSSSETLHTIQREALGAAFECSVFDYYGLAERVIFAGECERHGGKHVFDEYGVAEVVDDAGHPVPLGQPGWLVGTTLWNRGMPLIRYRTSDVSTRVANRCGCGRGLSRIADVATKAEDIVVTPDGRFVSPSVLTHPFKPFSQILKSQLIQDAEDHVVVKLVATAELGRGQRAELVAGLRERLGDGVRVDLVDVDDIPPEPSGKFRWVISLVPHDCAVSWRS